MTGGGAQPERIFRAVPRPRGPDRFDLPRGREATGRGDPGNGSFLSATEAYDVPSPSRRAPAARATRGPRVPRGRRAHRRLRAARGDRAGRDGGRLQGAAQGSLNRVVALKMILSGRDGDAGRARAVPPRGRAGGEPRPSQYRADLRGRRPRRPALLQHEADRRRQPRPAQLAGSGTIPGKRLAWSRSSPGPCTTPTAGASSTAT